jgi:hypothetical protein
MPFYAQVNVVTMVWDLRPEIRDSIPGEGKIFFSPQHAHPLWSLPNCLSYGLRASISEVKAADA